ncbi:MAG: T9SS type A sorting domain-containing protein [Bacteroidia bacterium]|nr:T9SS type A sorting domain-containing protein [Bacteroidia bacterium]
MIVWNCSMGQNWLGLNGIISGSGYVESLYANPVNTKLYIGGIFNATYNGKTMKNIMVYDGFGFDSLGAGVGSAGLRINDIIEYKNKIYIGGLFDYMGTKPIKGVAKWDGVKWDSLGEQMFGYVNTFKEYNNELYLGGRFTSIGGQPFKYIIKYDGTNWIPLFSPFPFDDGTGNSAINCIEVFQGQMYVGGNNFYDTSGNFMCLAKFNGLNWDTVNVKMSGFATEVFDMKVYNNKLYVAGRFKKTEGNVGNAIMRYDGTTWSDVGKAVTDVGNCLIKNMAVINNKLWVVGGFKSIEDTLIAGGIASWNDTVWCVPPTGSQNYQSTSIAYFQNKIIMGGAFYDIGNDTVQGIAVLNTDSTNCTINLTNVKTNILDEDFIISPNPFTDNIQIKLPSKFIVSETKFTITNNLGQVLVNFYPSSYSQILNLNNLASGVYYLTIKDISNNKTVKLIKQ